MYWNTESICCKHKSVEVTIILKQNAKMSFNACFIFSWICHKVSLFQWNTFLGQLTYFDYNSIPTQTQIGVVFKINKSTKHKSSFASVAPPNPPVPVQWKGEQAWSMMVH